MEREAHQREPAEPRWHRRKEDRPAEIMDAALQEFVAHGFAAARLEDVARRAGCTKGTIFLYFANKQELFKEMVRALVLPRLEQAETLVEQHQGSYRDLLEQLIRARWDMMVNSTASALPKLMFAEAGHFPDLARFYIDEVGARGQALIARVLRDGVAAGEFREMDAEVVAKVATAPLLVAAMWKHSFQPHCQVTIDQDRYFETAIDLLFRGIAREPDGGTRA